MDVRGGCPGFLLLLTVTLCAMMTQYVSGQAYHFSNGWSPGRKRSETGHKQTPINFQEQAWRSGLTDFQIDSSYNTDCHIQPEVQKFIQDLLQVSGESSVSGGSGQ